MRDSVAFASRLTLYPLAIVIAITVGVLVGAGSANSRGDAFGGDYGAFYGAGSIAAAGDWDDLYELDRQVAAQEPLPSEDAEPSARFFAYPPQVAFVYQPFARVSYFPSFLIHTALMGGLLVAAMWLAKPMIPWLRSYLLLGLAGALVFWPIFRSISGGSNTALTLFLIVAAWRLVHDENRFGAGVVLAVLLYKPQFALPLIGLFLLRRSWQVVVGAAAGGVVFYLTGVALLGWGWVGEWLEVAAEFGKLDAEINGHSAISFVGFAENLFGVGVSGATVAAWGLVVVCVVFLSWIWWRDPRAGLDRLMAVTMPGVLLISPHAMSHDGALIVLTAAVAGSHWRPRRWTPWVVAVWVLGATQLGIKQLGFSPGFAMLLITLFWGWLIVDESPSRSVEERLVSDGRVS